MNIFDALKDKPVFEVIQMAEKQGKCLRYIRRGKKCTAEVVHIGVQTYWNVEALH